jgi:putative ABC transport system permease protein
VFRVSILVLHEKQDAFAMALDSLRSHRLRSLLTVLGIVIGIATVTVISSIIHGLNARVAAQMEGVGSKLIYVYHTEWATLGRVSPDLLNRKKLTQEDAIAIRASCSSIEAVCPLIRIFLPQFGEGTMDIEYRGEVAKNVIVQGVGQDFEAVFDVPIDDGRALADFEHRRRSMVCVVGHDTASMLFPSLDPIGKEIAVAQHQFTVVGVLGKQKDTLNGGANPDDNLINVPLETFRQLYPDRQDYLLAVKAKDQAQVSSAIEEIRDLLRRRRKVRSNQDDDFEIFTQDVLVESWRRISTAIATAMFIISSIGLLVGGVGVMNIMLVSVTERTREIGVRRAVGASRRHIWGQFLLEAVVLTASGGGLGIVIGSAIALLLGLLAGIPALLSVFWMMTAFSLSVGIGLVSGLYPAYRAARLNPLEALRCE